jgi:hypothetical protein
MVRVPPPRAAVLGWPPSVKSRTGTWARFVAEVIVRLCRSLIVLSAIVLLAASYRTRTAVADEWQPISPEELRMTSVAEAPGAPAVILYRQVDRDDSARTGNQYNYVRIKILTDEGRKYGDVEIPFFKEQGTVHGLKARTIRPDAQSRTLRAKLLTRRSSRPRG